MEVGKRKTGMIEMMRQLTIAFECTTDIIRRKR